MSDKLTADEIRREMIMLIDHLVYVKQGIALYAVRLREMENEFDLVQNALKKGEELLAQMETETEETRLDHIADTGEMVGGDEQR